MTRDETILLWKQCEEARTKQLVLRQTEVHAHEAAKNIWNSWAETMLSERLALERDGNFLLAYDVPRPGWIAPATIAANEATGKWLQKSTVNFSEYTFSQFADFSDFIFPGNTFFGYSVALAHNRRQNVRTIFEQPARFNYARFHLDAIFDRVKFQEQARFSYGNFLRNARFSEVIFNDPTLFYNVEFAGEVWFGQAKFFNYTTFAESQFKSSSAFVGIDSKSAFDLDNATFYKVPDFTQADFSQAPRLDRLRLADNIEPGGFFKSTFSNSATSYNLASRYRALRRLAIQGHDQENEAKAFKGEVRSRRGSVDKPWSAAFWFGVFYDILSDYGRSIMRPFLIWLISTIAFAAFYFWNAGISGASWFETCAGANVSRIVKALTLSAANALPIIGSNRTEESRAFYNCIAAPHIPEWSSVIQTGQTLWSAVLIFLFLLAVRNQFRIK